MVTYLLGLSAQWIAMRAPLAPSTQLQYYQ